MRRLQRISWLAVLAALALLGTAAGAAAQGKEKEKDAGKPARFVTADKVEIEGTFYASPQGKASRTVMLLHAYGEHSQKTEWKKLANALNKKGYSVLMFDFRGHGESTKVQPGTPNTNPMLAIKGFWDEKENQYGVKGLAPGKPRPTDIAHSQFASTYMRILVNDIAAAKAYLDDLDSNGECNSGDIILLGANEGATLGAIWMNAEWHRYKYLPKQPGLPQGGLDLQNPEGRSITCAVWLSITSIPGTQTGQTIHVPATLTVPGKDRKVPMAFFYGDGNSKDEKVALACEKWLKGMDKENYPFTGAVKLPKAGKASGYNLLSKALGTEKEIITYLENALEGKAIQKHKGLPMDSYQWQVVVNGRVQRAPARLAGATNFVFASYQYFIRQGQ